MAEIAGPLSQTLTVDRLGRGVPADANARLVLHRCAVVEGNKLDENPLLDWAVATGVGHQPALAAAVAERRRAVVAALPVVAPGQTGAQSARLVVLVPEMALLAGTGEAGVRNVGLALHGTYGWPVLRGSSLKGVTHAYARDVAGLSQPQRLRIFGGRPGDDVHPGAVTFLDATWTEVPPKVRRHVMTPHVGPYYTDREGTNAPAEYWNPVPVEFLAVESGMFLATLIGPVDLLDQVEQLLAEAVYELGTGAKTASGYGYLRVRQVAR